MRPAWRLGAAAVALVLAVGWPVLPLAPGWTAARATEVTPDDVVDGYVADGSLVLDETFDGSAADRASASACPGCRWRYEPYCRGDR